MDDAVCGPVQGRRGGLPNGLGGAACSQFSLAVIQRTLGTCGAIGIALANAIKEREGAVEQLDDHHPIAMSHRRQGNGGYLRYVPAVTVMALQC
ncbi:hypothetical protein [Sphingobium yanoikuyae]|jgi:hypothetical protein|uniref:hypothetical protein n=1 Tax=Sphingobium yanoikuyae TaxID=13690 RepID=UPI0004E34574|nr:hypothetical protein [Sphingobium yanoikuyae]KFD26682.1 hypothetical protein IH86_18725 [Sphingobium yanoikuyae]MDV3482001.1 hypothetical protein [Sphingobium yanoikuyae]